MIEHCWRQIHFPMTWEQFHELPKHSAYKQEYFDGELWLTPRPRYVRALFEFESSKLDLSKHPPGLVRLLCDDDWPALAGPFAMAFIRIAPFDSYEPAERIEKARGCLEETRTGIDGPLVANACFVAEHEHHGVIGAILITLVPKVELASSHSLRWNELPPEDCIERLMGRPHLTWIFVEASMRDLGIGKALLSRSLGRLKEIGYGDLATTIMAHDESSLLWHWRNGFTLQSKLDF